MKRVKTFLYFLLFFMLVAAALGAYLAREFFTPVSATGSRTRVVIPAGASAEDVANLLEENDLVRHGWSFRLLVRLTGTGVKIKSGTYSLSSSSSPYEILKKLVSGESLLVRITIPEGFTLRQIASLLAAKQIVGAQSFLLAARKAGLEGFLFPDTYELSPGISPEEAYAPMEERFQNMVLPIYRKSRTHRSLEQIITIASLVEREAGLPKERPLVAAVIYNRLKDKMPLQCDATIQFLLPDPTVHLTDKDFMIPSPYNTYLHSGLPPGPIANPGLAAIRAALHPAHVPYLYYVADGKGGHRFSTTYPEHLHNVRLYQRWLSKHDKE